MPAQLQELLVSTGRDVIASLLIIVVTALTLKLWNGAVSRVVRRLMARTENAPRERQLKLQTLASVTRASGSILIITIASLMVISQFADIGPLLAGAGVVGIAIGLGAQAFIRDLIGGFFILLEDHYSVGDVIKVNNQYDGLVEHLDLRRTVLRNLEGWVYNIPNGEIRVVANMTRGWSRLVVDLPVEYSASIDHVLATLEGVSDELLADPDVGSYLIERPSILGVEAFGEYRVTIRVLLKTQPMKQWDTGRRYRALVKKAFDREGIRLPDPRRIILSESDGMGGRQPEATGAPHR